MNYDDLDFSQTVTLGKGQKKLSANQQDWLTLSTKGQKIRASFVYFNTFDVNLVSDFVAQCKDQGKPYTSEDLKKVGGVALKKLAEKLGKEVEALTEFDKIDTSRPAFKVLRSHYKEGVGSVLSRLGKDGPEADKLWQSLGEPKTHATTLLLVYPCDDDGDVNGEEFVRMVKAGKIKLVPWKFSQKLYEKIYRANAPLIKMNTSLSQMDVIIECTNPAYKDAEIQADGNATWLQHEAIKKAVLEKAIPMYKDLNPFREMTTEQLREKLGMGGSDSSGDRQSSVDISSVDFDDMLKDV